MINLSEDGNEELLVELIDKIDTSSEKIQLSLKSKNTIDFLNETCNLFSLLEIDCLIPSNYLLLFNKILEVTNESIDYYFKEEVYCGTAKKIKYLYETVQQSQKLIPRLYLMIITGTIFLENSPKYSKEILYDLFNYVKCVQNPLRGFFVRFFLFYQLKNLFSEKFLPFFNENDSSLLIFNYLIENLEEMNLFLMRMKKEILIDFNILPDDEREDMFKLMIEMFGSIGGFKNLTLNIYENKVLPKLINIFMQSTSDGFCEKYLIEGIIKSFPVNYNIECNSLILFAISRLRNGLDKNNIFISLINRILKFIHERKKNLTNEEKQEFIYIPLQKIYPLLLFEYKVMQNSFDPKSSENEFISLIDIDIIFMKFTIKCLTFPENLNKLSIINSIFEFCEQKVNKFTKGFSFDAIKKVMDLVEYPLEHNYTMFELINMQKLIIYLDFDNRKKLGRRVLESFTINKPKKPKKKIIDSVEKMDKLIEIILPFLDDPNPDSKENFMIENEKNVLCKLLFCFQTNNPYDLLQIYNKYKKAIFESKQKYKIFIIKILINYLILFCQKLSLKNDKDDKFNQLINDTFILLNECISIIEKDTPRATIKLIMIAISTFNYCIEGNRNIFKEKCEALLDVALVLFKSDILNIDEKYNVCLDFFGYLPLFGLVDKDKIISVIKVITSIIDNMNKKENKFCILINVSQLYYSIIKDGNLSMEYINNAKKLLEEDFSNIDNIKLCIDFSNKMIYYIENDNDAIIKGKDEILIEMLNKLHDNENIKNDNNIQKYYNNTIRYIEKKKDNEKYKAIYDSIK